MIRVNTATGFAEFPAVTCTCPVFHGIDDVEVQGGNMRGSCDAPTPDTVWSGYFPMGSMPQAVSGWANASSPGLLCGSDQMQGSQAANCYSFLCTKAGKLNGVDVATCTCPIGEAFDGTAVPPNTAFFTQAGQCAISVCSEHPVSCPLGFDDIKTGGECIHIPERPADNASLAVGFQQLMAVVSSADVGEPISSATRTDQR
jgi:hypothetical protein